jgi:8-oxo-dGTP pyrophosphatase MutT (NUDIX family)
MTDATVTDVRVVRIEQLDLELAPRPWPFAQSRRAEIDAHFARRKAERPALFNGEVLVLYEHAVEGSVFRGSYLKTNYASFMSWLDWNYPEAGARDSFSQGALRSADGAFLVGVMGQHTANAGKIYFPGGTPDPSDVKGSAVDLTASVWREVEEETGLTAADLDAEPGWHSVFVGAQIAHLKIMQAREDAVALRARILAFLAQQDPPELSDIRIVRSLADLDPRMLPFVVGFLREQWPAGSDRQR